MTVGFLADVATKALELDKQFAAFESSHEAVAELQRRLGRLHRATLEHDHLDMRRQLVLLCAQATRMARDCHLETEASAVELDDAGLKGT